MALVKCPECGREVSDSAAACPNCGFPVKEHFEDLRYEEEKRKNEAERKAFIKKRQATLKKSEKFCIFDKDIYFTENQRILMSLIYEITDVRYKAHITVRDLFFVSYDIFYENQDDFNGARGQLEKWVTKTINPIALTALRCVKRNLIEGAYYIEPEYEDEDEYEDDTILDQHEELLREIERRIYDGININGIIDGLLELYMYYWNKELDLEYLNLRSAINNITSSSHSRAIDYVYADSLTGLLKSRIKASLINEIADYAQEKAKNKHLNRTMSQAEVKIAEIDRPRIALLLDRLDTYVNEAFLRAKKVSIDLLLELNVIMDDKDYGYVNQSDLVANIPWNNDEELDPETKERFVNAVKEWPFLTETYSIYCSWIDLGDNAKEIKRLCEHFSIMNELKKYLDLPTFIDDFPTPLNEDWRGIDFNRLCNNYEKNMASLGIGLSEKYIEYRDSNRDFYNALRTYKGILYNTIEEANAFQENERKQKELELKREEEAERKRLKAELKRKKEIESRTIGGVTYSSLQVAEEARGARDKAQCIIEAVNEKTMERSELIEAKQQIEMLNKSPEHCLDDMLPMFEKVFIIADKRNRTYGGVLYETYEKRDKAEKDFATIFKGINVKQIDAESIKSIKLRLDQTPDCTKAIREQAEQLIEIYEIDSNIYENIGDIDCNRGVSDGSYLEKMILTRNTIKTKHMDPQKSKRYVELEKAIKEANNVREEASQEKSKYDIISTSKAIGKIILFVLIGIVAIILDIVFVRRIFWKVLFGIVIFVVFKILIADEINKCASDISWVHMKNKAIEEAKKRMNLK